MEKIDGYLHRQLDAGAFKGPKYLSASPFESVGA
jgi:hypothetical protein